MDIVKFTLTPQSETELKALIEEINNHASLSDEEMQQLLQELNEWNRSSSEPLQ
ncbi:hypothetical protein ACFQI7_03890 [Paenibacillus allorhizosphaerae]|uniref:Uncharacterized protein n=1 Tax=Paenibacillus allorhizosphaerae TaxID=2849866 RepID=A0ABM8VD49_9BACL|nr:hypothetical protein [Paenibacillus allorhizosphaerae]CAG7624300.1 hypothetical protein PAECIP111802_01047 [Paenibacillus allorhizosphaerae]